METASLQLKVKGMRCQGCANRLEKAILDLEGIVEANVNFAAESLSTSYDVGKTQAPLIETTPSPDTSSRGGSTD